MSYWFSSRALGTYCASAGTVPTHVLDALGKEAGVERRSACVAHMFGLFVGRAFAYDAKTTLTLGTPKTRVREVDPHLSIGVAFLPASPLSVLLGLTVSDVTRDDSTAARLVTPHLALGLNFDALAMIGNR